MVLSTRRAARGNFAQVEAKHVSGCAVKISGMPALLHISATNRPALPRKEVKWKYRTHANCSRILRWQ